MNKLINLTFIVSVSLFLTGCGNSGPSLPDTPSFKQGEKDGCATATGEYTKNSDAFEMDKDYQQGWFHGRKSCNPSQNN